MENLFVNLEASLNRFLTATLPGSLPNLAMALASVVVILLFVLTNVVWLVYMERKVAAYMQDRLGPNRVGPRGLLQTVADVLKLLGKEDIVPVAADKWVFKIAAVTVLIPTIMLFAVIPFGNNLISIDLNIGVFYFVAISSTATISFLMAGWASNNKYSLLGGMRVVAQMIAYEIPLVFSLLGVVMLAGSLKMSDIVAAQKDVWFIVLQPVAFLIYFIAGTAELNRGPFDLPEAEQELIAGPFTEYSGFRYAMFFLAEYGNMVAISALAVTLFLGGPSGPWLPSWMWFVIKVYVMIFLFMWLKWTLPRIRLDHMMQFNWKFLLPLSLANILLTGIAIKLF